MAIQKFFLAKGRKLSTEILIVFLFLIAVSSTTIISFTYYKNNKLIGNLAEGTINQVTLLISGKIECMLNSLSLLPKAGASYAGRHPEEVVPSPTLLAFLQSELQSHPNLYSFYVGAPNGSSIGVFNLALADKPKFFADSAKRIPQGAAYAIDLVDRTKEPSIESWIFLDKDGKKISSFDVIPLEYDPRARPWYVGAKETGKLYWTDLFLYESTGEQGIAVSIPVYNEKKELRFIFGADLSLQLFCGFLTDQKIGTQGKAFILDTAGKVIVPNKELGEGISRAIVSQAYAQYQEEKEKDFSFTIDNVKYLAAMAPFPLDFGKNWLILVIDPISDYFSGAIKTENQVVLISLAILLLAAILVVYFAKHISAPIVILANEVDKITRLELDSERRVQSDIQEINQMDYSIADLRNAIRSFSRYAPKEVVKELMLNGKEIALGGEKKEITVLFTDIIEFTPIAETLPVETLNLLLAQYFDLLSKIILDNRGTIDKYIGDSIMAFWGAPQEMPDQVSRACTTALLCQAALAKLHQEWGLKNLPPFETRIGINTGNVIVGNIGTSERMNYTVIGDAVNATSRIQLLNKVYHTKILIGGDVQAKIGNEFLVRPIDVVEVKGKKQKIKIYELVAKKEGPLSPSQDQLELCASFTKAYDAYHGGNDIEARKLFGLLNRRFPDDFPTQHYINLLHG